MENKNMDVPGQKPNIVADAPPVASSKKKKVILVGCGFCVLLFLVCAGIGLPMVAKLKRAALKVAAENEAREMRSGMESKKSMEMEMEGGLDIMTGGDDGRAPIAAAPPESEETTDGTTEGNTTVAWISDPDNPQNMLVEQKIRDELNKPTGALTEGDMEKLFLLNFVLTTISDEGLKEVATLKQLKVLRIIKANITDAGLKEVATLTELKVLELDATLITDAGLKEVARLEQLETLGLSSTQVTDEGLMHLVPLKNLRELTLKGTKVTKAGVTQLQKALPNCAIDH